jgi:hypothetical protein
VNVKGLSRFTDAAEAKQTDRRAGRRDGDVVVGTHRCCRRRAVEGPRPGHRGRGAAIRRRAQGAHHGACARTSTC